MSTGTSKKAHGYGSTAARLEAFLSRLTTALGHHRVLRSTPTEIVCGFQEDGSQWQRTHLATLPGTGLDNALEICAGETNRGDPGHDPRFR